MKQRISTTAFLTLGIYFLLIKSALSSIYPNQRNTRKKKPNVVLIITDQLRWDALGYMGNSVVKTPNIDKLAEQGIVFENTYCTSPLSSPSRVGLFSGLYPHTSGSITNNSRHFIKADEYSFVKTLHENGYVLGNAGKNDTWSDKFFDTYFDYREQYRHHGKEVGTLTKKDRELAEYMHKDPRKGEQYEKANIMLEGLIEEPAPFKPEKWITSRLTSDAIEFVDEYRDSTFFLHLSYPGPHWPQIVPEPYYSMYKTSDIPDLEGKNIDWTKHPFKHFVQSNALGFDEYTAEQRKKILAIYYGQITFIDQQIGRFLNHLNDKGLRENTIIIFIGDHGDFGGQFNLIGKTGGFYEPLIRIPMIIDFDKDMAFEKCDASISNIDVFPTILDHLGLSYPQNIDGKSFMSVLTGKKNQHRNEIYCEVGSGDKAPPPVPHDTYQEYAMKRASEDGGFWFIEYTVKGKSVMVKKDNWKYVYYRDDINEMYNLTNDPLELINLAGNEMYLKKENELKNLLLEWLLGN